MMSRLALFQGVLLLSGIYVIPLSMDCNRPTDIVIAAFNARYAHTSFGARCLLANLGQLRAQAGIMEFDLQVRPRTAAEKILAKNPRIIGIGCYIWNIELVTRIAALIKGIRPDIRLILGGPEISYETEEQEIFRYADHVICGEGEVAFRELCCEIISHQDTTPRSASTYKNGSSFVASCLGVKKIKSDPVDVVQIELPYDLYTDEDIAHRAIYVESSRGCPFRCEYCMSSLDSKVRYFPEGKLFPAFQKLLDRGARNFKFVDRTFNIDMVRALNILAFFHERYEPGMMLHFEMIPDRLPGDLMEAVRQCPPGMLQFEIGIQTFNEEVAHRIQRPLDIEKIETNIRRLRNETGVHIHSDLIAGLPGEDIESFAAGFDRLLALNPQEIQLGILKRLRGAPIDRHSGNWNMIYSPHAPYEVLSTNSIPFEQMQRIQRFARYWNLTVNNGQFINAAPLIWSGAPSPFAAFMKWSDWLYAKTGTTANLNMVRLAKLLLEFLTEVRAIDEKRVAKALFNDYRRGNRPDVPGFLKKYGFKPSSSTEAGDMPTVPLPRQSRHMKQ